MSRAIFALSLALFACGGGDPAESIGSGGEAGSGGGGAAGTGGQPQTGGATGSDVCAEIEAALPGALTKAATPGAIVALDTDAASCRAAAGVSVHADSTPADPQQAYLIGSSTKTFIAAAIVALHREGKITEANDSVEDWLPGLVPNGAAITVGHLLTHTSGLTNYTEVLKELQPDSTQPTTPEALVKMALGKPSPAEPGKVFAYNNTGFILLGMIIEKASGETWQNAIRSRFLTPLGLSHTYGDAGELPPGTPMLHSYVTLNGAELDVTTYSHPSWAGAAGSMVSTLDDMTRWTRALYGGEVFDAAYTQALLEPLVVISEENAIYYSLGTIIHDTPFGRWVGHGGTLAGTLSYMGFMPATNIVVQGAVNHDAANRFTVADVAWQAALGEGLGTLAPFVSN